MPSWQLDELVEQYTQLAAGPEPLSARKIRYYTTLGMVDRPRIGKDKFAYYEPKHLLQLLMIVRLRAEGHKLAEIQKAMAGLSREKMRELLGLSEGWLNSLPEAEQPAPTDFWSQRPPPLEEPTPEFPVRLKRHLDIVPEIAITINGDCDLDSRALQQFARKVKDAWASVKGD